MKLEDILPEIRKGRRYRYGNHQPWNINIEALWQHTFTELEGDDWELEPEYTTLKVTEEEFLCVLNQYPGAGLDILDRLKELSEGR